MLQNGNKVIEEATIGKNLNKKIKHMMSFERLEEIEFLKLDNMQTKKRIGHISIPHQS